MRLGFWLSIAFGALTAACASAGCTQDFDQFEPAGGSGDCGAGEKLCGGACVSAADPAYGCGAGCTPCALANAVAVCAGGACAIDQCAPGAFDCDGAAADGCEADTGSDPANCGACGASCVTPNATPACQGGQCAIDGCAPGYVDCNGAPADGCEADTASDPAHCGGCATACNPFESCQAGACVLMCPAGMGDCDGNPGNGCETTFGTVTDCGFCGDACDLANATPICTQGACAVTACDLNYGDCDGVAANGCEANLDTSATTCGDCNTVCPSGPHSTAVCNMGACALTCMGTYGDCNGDPNDGCEVDTAISTAHCGACGRPCAGDNVMTAVCAAGLCASTCTAGFGNCYQPAAPAPDNGCETDLGASVANCGACGRPCSGLNVASRSCSGGTCDSTCDLGFANCAEPTAPGADDGCELNVTANDASCGGCGNACSGLLDCDRPNAGPAQKYCGCSTNQECDTDGNGPATGTCTASIGLCTCGVTVCGIGEACVNVGGVNQCSCNGGAGCGAAQACCLAPNGCFDLQTSPASCGACGRACPAGFACQAGACACDADADCDAGAGAAFSCTLGTGRCVCGATTCQPGERCLPSGLCG
jgi:hypothetical protein